MNSGCHHVPWHMGPFESYGLVLDGKLSLCKGARKNPTPHFPGMSLARKTFPKLQGSLRQETNRLETPGQLSQEL
jgi:hypothetical protein